jgi:hypothetical protein
MKDTFENLKDFYPWMVTYFPLIIALLGVMPLLQKLGTKLWKLGQQRKLQKDLHPFYTKQEIQRATQYYVETKCQNIAPSKEDELRETSPFSAKEKIIPFFLKKAFKPMKDECQFYIVLADSGMGKTTFLINLYLRYIDQFFRPQYQIKLLPFAFPEIDKEIEKIPNDVKRQTILLLDAFDEDIQAVQDYKTRLHDLIQKVLYFREVVITCRTQFFPSEAEEPGETGVLRFGPEGGSRVFHKFYISPFDDNDIRAYLRKRFAWFQVFKKRKAKQIVKYSPNLMVRPMLLSYIGDLLQSEHPYTATYMVYAELINKWIEREANKVPPARREHYKEELFRFSREIAVDIYRYRADRKGSLLIPGEVIKPFAEKHGINLEEMEMKARSLFNRNARGDYKFSHKSILEYFLAEEAFFNPEFRQELDVDGMDQANAFFEKMIRDKLTVPFFSQGDLTGEYRLKDGKSRVLTKLPEKLLPEVTYLKLQEWKESDDVLLFRGLKNLKWLDLGIQMTVTQHHELKQILSTCQIFRYVSEDEAQQVFGLTTQKFKIADTEYSGWRPLEYIQNEYEDQGEVVVDHATGLMWQKSGSPNFMTYQEAQAYIEQLNTQKFAGYSDWRLPTIPELMSLLEPEKQSNDLYINPIFDAEQWWCWSADRRIKGESSPGAAWRVYFDVGSVYWGSLNSYYVRAVRS